MIKTIIIGIIITVIGLFTLSAVDKAVNTNTSGTTNTAEVENSGQDENDVKVSISGEVTHPGDYYISGSSTLDDLITMAGGTTSKADAASYNGTILIGSRTSFYISAAVEKDQACVETAVVKVSINTGTETELAGIGFSKSQASALIDYRKEHGSFVCIDDILNVPGIGQGTFEKVKNKISLS
ncbi:MAG: helix-hairpin-helix domain-containing protein [Bacilli bacterium]